MCATCRKMEVVKGSEYDLHLTGLQLLTIGAALSTMRDGVAAALETGQVPPREASTAMNALWAVEVIMQALDDLTDGLVSELDESASRAAAEMRSGRPPGPSAGGRPTMNFTF